jgi:hypothetical protein
MSRRDPATARSADHARARELAAARLDETLPAQDAAWLDAHLATCDACRTVADGYDLGRSALRALRAGMPEPPRDLWARTSAALEAEQGRRARRRRLGRLDLGRFGRLAAAPVAGLLVVALVAGSGLLGGHGILPVASGPAATPISLTAAADLRVLTRSVDGSVNLVTGPVKAVCPIGSESCGAAPSFAVTPLEGVTTGPSMEALLSPSQDRMVVVNRGQQGVFIVPMATAEVVVTPSPRPSQSHGATVAASPSPTAGASASASTTAVASATPAPTTTPPGTPGPDSTASPTAPGASPVTSPSPSIAVSPAPDGTIQIASGVTVVGAVVYSPDGARVAFAARPSDGATGPDIYVWTSGDATAHALTTDHASQLAGWTVAGILAARAVDGKPATFLIDPASGDATAVPGSAWMPVVNAAGTAAAWWDGTVRLAADGVTWVADAGRLVVGAWPPSAVASPAATTTPGATSSPAASPQAIAQGPFDAWEVRWDEGGTVLAIWTHTGNAEKPGHLSLYPIDAATGLAGLTHPLLDSVPAAAGFSLRTGRLVWSGPGQSGQDALQVLAWNGTNVGRLELPADHGATVVP